MEAKLWNDKREREMYENFAELYAIIKATEKLEKAYVRDIVPSSEYETECQKLIAHFKTLVSSLKDTVPSIERFTDTYKMDCPAAINRLVTSGVPATVEHRAAAAASSTTSASIVAECVQNFITAMDSLKLNMVAVDQVYPLLSDLSASLNKLSILPPDFEGKTKMKEWLLRLSKMGASDELTEQQARQLHFDLESSYNSFMAALPSADANPIRLPTLDCKDDDNDACEKWSGRSPISFCPVQCFWLDPVCGVNGTKVAKKGFCEVVNNGAVAQALLLVHIVWLIVLGFSILFGLF
ncbi:hypothetical protein DKX38_005503 [Salix brachista]|uniref:Vacuolar protein sorting-associated protein 28 homolog n=1 Tax=Salix brachista TaxID=2182728 RepID=A0A5N5N2W4_9ROSI|nr:hypothetical protein DKX38_005503 [Salix brachista]